MDALKMLSVAPDFLTSYWRHAPFFMPAHAYRLSKICDWRHSFAEWCVPPAAARIFTLNNFGRICADQISDLSCAYEIYEKIISLDIPATLLLNHTEKVSPVLTQIHRALDVRQDWRRGDIVATLSSFGSGIGFHAGNEDGFIVQLHGSRRWRIWDSKYTTTSYRNHLLGIPVQRYRHPTRPLAAPCLQVTLSAGDVLYIPPFFGHEGVTLENSVSLSVAWRGLTPYTVLSAIVGGDHELNDWRNTPTRQRQAYSKLIPDPKDFDTDPWTYAINSSLDIVHATQALREAVRNRISPISL